MPIHRIPRADLEAKYVELERSGERVNHVVPEGDEYVLITSEKLEFTIDPRISPRAQASGKAILEAIEKWERRSHPIPPVDPGEGDVK